MEISLQFYTPARLHQEEKSPTPAGQEAVWTPENIWTWGRISANFDTVDIYENLSKTPNLVKIGQKYRAHYMKTWIYLCCRRH
jgi:hypothetical protein